MVINTVEVENIFENTGLNGQKGEIRKEVTKKIKYFYTISNKIMKYDSKGIMVAIDKIINVYMCKCNHTILY